MKISTLFITADKRKAISSLLKEVKEMYKQYPKDSVKHLRLKRMATQMWNELQDEFYMSADISKNTIWKWQDMKERFDEETFLFFENDPREISKWSSFLISLKDEWTIEILNLIKDFNLDCQQKQYVDVFMNDFMKIKNKTQFCSALYKWNDLIYWSPWKLSMLDCSFVKSVSSGYTDEFNDDISSFDEFELMW